MTRDAHRDARTDRRPTDEDGRRTDTRRGPGHTLADVSHTNPHTGRSFGGNFTFARGGAVAADGGRPDVVPEDEPDAEDEDEEPDTLEDVEHTPPNESDDANRVFERGKDTDDSGDE